MRLMQLWHIHFLIHLVISPSSLQEHSIILLRNMVFYGPGKLYDYVKYSHQFELHVLIHFYDPHMHSCPHHRAEDLNARSYTQDQGLKHD